MLFADLSATQQALLQNNDLMIRTAVLLSRKAIVAMKQVALDYTTISQPIYSTLDAGTEVPTQTGLAGAISVPKEEVDAMVTAFEQLIAVWDTSEVRAEHAKFVGAVNIG